MALNEVMPVQRIRPPEDGQELETLTGMLDYLRNTIVFKVAGLSDEQAFSHPIESSDLTPAGLVKHLAAVERWWFTIDFGGATDVPWPWTDDDPHGGFPLAPTDTLAAIVADYLAECERSRRSIAGASLDEHARAEDMDFTLRYAIVHMIEETARHCGHMDMMRERIDGSRGE
ncbi:MAG TPA: DinB family protein [Candidatus Limnocylindrales bacterium]